MRRRTQRVSWVLVVGLLLALSGGCNRDLLEVPDTQTPPTTTTDTGGNVTPTKDTTGGTTQDQDTPDESVTQISFANEILPILEQKCGSCHKNGAGGWKITGVASDDYSVVFGAVDLNSPGDSLVLTKGGGETSHGGGDQLSDEEYALILNWIKAGATGP